jgi:Domain of unknown function (DUF4062)
MARRQLAEHESLIIDRAAAAEIPSDQQVREWAHGKRGFISSVMAELQPERKAAATAIRTIGATPIMFESFGGRDADPEDAYLGEVETADIYIGIIGRKYGRPLKTRFSATHTEYLHAEQSGLRIAVWCLDAQDREGHEESLLDEVRSFHVVPTFSSPDDLRAQIEERLRALSAEDLAPWCKLGNVVFRASEVADGGEQIQVTARVRSDEVAHALEALRGEKGLRGDDARFSWAGRSRFVRLESLKTTTTTSRSRIFHLTLERREERRDSLIEMSINGRSAAEIAEIALRVTLFQERNPLEDRHMGFMTEMPDPLEPLRVARVPDEIVRPLAELLIVDELVGSGRAERVTAFRLGGSVGGARKLTLEWIPFKHYTNDRATTLRIEGQVRL